MLRIPDFPVHHRGLLWESASQINHVFVAWSDEKLDVYVYHAERLTGNFFKILKGIIFDFIDLGEFRFW